MLPSKRAVLYAIRVEKNTKQNQGLQKHLNSKHGASGGNMKLECQTCKLKFTTKGHLEGHVNSHHDLNHMPARFVITLLAKLRCQNDMPETIIHSEIRLFADDTILFRAINGTIDSQLLQEDLTALEN
jgi:hypothetical protein